MRDTVADGALLYLGKCGEQGATRILFPFADTWRALFGEGTFQLLVRRPTEDEPYAAPVTEENGNAVWEVGAADTAVAGLGKCELVYVAGERIAKSVTYLTRTDPSLGEAAAEAPAPWSSWVDSVLRAGAQAQQGAETGTAAAREAVQAGTAARSAADGAVDARDAAIRAEANARVSAASAQAAVGQMAYVSFTMSGAGHLVMKNADLAGTTVFALGSDGHMEVTL